MSSPSQSTAELLGFASDARVLLVNADDFGMCHAENAATVEGLDTGAYDSATVMVPCPWFKDTAGYARRNPKADIGVHITHTSEWEIYKWGPVSGPGEVPRLVLGDGFFPRDVETLYRLVGDSGIDEMERETRAQIERALDTGIDVTHLDSHMGTVQLDPRYHELYVRIAADYKLPIRRMARGSLIDMGMERVVQLADKLGVLSPDKLWVGGPSSPAETEAYWSDFLRHLSPGVTEIFIHAGIDTPEGHAITPAWRQRVSDHQFFLADSTRRLLDDLNIQRVGYRALRDRQRELTPC